MADNEDTESSCNKKAKFDNNSSPNNETVHDSLDNLSHFKTDAVLNNNTNRKTICLKGTFTGKDGVGIVLLEKTAFAEKELTNGSKYFSQECYLEKDFSNDIYGNYIFFPTVELNGIKATIIHPATEKHIGKFAAQNIYLVDETIEIYKTVTLPHIEKEQFNLQWLYNVLNHTKESERIVFEDSDPKTGFVLLPDLKWDGKTVDTLYLIALVHPKGIKSLRDLTGDHIDLLQNIFDKGTKAIEEKYGLDASQLRIYLHYQPFFYHLHVHFTYLRHDAPGIFTEKSHMLCNVISNLKLLPDYYQKVTLPFVVKESDNLYKTLVEKNILKQN